VTEQSILSDVLGWAAPILGIDVDMQDRVALASLVDELLAWNERANLTGIRSRGEIEVKHVLDSLTIVPVLRALLGPVPGEVVDVGTGAGFPGLPVALLLPMLRFVLVDATRKKVEFVHHVVKKLRLRNVVAIHSAAEDLGRDGQHRERYDAAVTRAVASIPTLVELLIPLVRVGGYALLMKTRKGVDRELPEAERALRLLGSVVVSVDDACLPEILPDRVIVTIRKSESTDPAYPRRPGLPRRRPL